MATLRRLLIITTATVLLASIALADIDYDYHGTLVSTPDDGTGIWVNNPGDDLDWFPARIEWEVGQNEDGSWHYAYFINVYQGDVSHFILETSEPFGDEDIFGESGKFEELVIGDWFYPVGGNLDMPAPVYGVKFDDTEGTYFWIQFDSWRQPVWGDFYSKDGQAGGEGLNQFWNSGFSLPDPTAPPWDTTIDDHILRPDSYIPEPGTMTLLGLGLLGLGYIRRRKVTD